MGQQSYEQVHEKSATKQGQIRRAGSAVPIEVDSAVAPTQTPSHAPGQAIRLRGQKRYRGKR